MMTIEQCYQALGGSFTEVSMRLPSVRLVEKFIEIFLDDGSFDELCRQVASGSRQEAFRAAHTLKGVCANLGFGRLLSSSSRLTDYRLVRSSNAQSGVWSTVSYHVNWRWK